MFFKERVNRTPRSYPCIVIPCTEIVITGFRVALFTGEFVVGNIIPITIIVTSAFKRIAPTVPVLKHNGINSIILQRLCCQFHPALPLPYQDGLLSKRTLSRQKWFSLHYRFPKHSAGTNHYYGKSLFLFRWYPANNIHPLSVPSRFRHKYTALPFR